MDDTLILVDANDNPLGFEQKLKCHEGDGMRHRAFTVCLVDGKGNILMTRRAENKLLWPKYWSNSCCSHPRKGEDIMAAARRRIKEELNITVDDLENKGTIVYQAKYLTPEGKWVGSENEYCYVFEGITNVERLTPNPEEVMDTAWCDINMLLEDMEYHAEKYAPWFILAVRKAYGSQ